ncbi:MAG: hypothetical protein UY10_C0039G0006 [Microgenomates group bacterium GW2011_GWA2_47_8]|nr:MAG: hypothetical protein UY10_C0039G0006 [Microgenomates group bacterium GW2011_GWA2_47_8]
MTNQNILIACAVTAVVAGGLGYTFGSRMARVGRFADFGERNGARVMTNRDQNKQGSGGMMGRGGALTGEVTAKDDKTLTIKLSDGSSKIVILADTTTYRTSTETGLDKVEVGTKVAAYGTTSTDGTTVATSIEINPQMFGRLSGNK